MDSVSKRGLENMLPEIERETGIRFEFDTICEVIRYAARKLNAIGKGAEYFPVLLESELRDYATREIINMKGEINCVRKMIIAVISGVWNSIVAIWSGLASWFGSIPTRRSFGKPPCPSSGISTLQTNVRSKRNMSNGSG